MSYKNEFYESKSHPGLKWVAAHPGNGDHLRLYVCLSCLFAPWIIPYSFAENRTWPGSAGQLYVRVPAVVGRGAVLGFDTLYGLAEDCHLCAVDVRQLFAVGENFQRQSGDW